MYYYPNYNYRQIRYQNNRVFPGAFLVPFGLGFLTAPLVFRPRPYYNSYYGPNYGPYYY